MSNIQESIFDAVSIIADEKINQIKFDKTIECIIESDAKYEKGEYTAKYRDIIIKVFSNNNTVRYSKGTNVYVLVPEGNFSNKKTIIGKVEAEGEEFVSFEDIFDKIETLEGNYVNEPADKEFEVKPNVSGETVYRELSFKNDKFITDYPNKLNLLIGGTIESNLPNINGDFGMILDLTYLVKGKEVRHKYELTTDSIVGNPYQLSGAYQYKVFPLFIEQLIRVNGMYLYIKDFKGERVTSSHSVKFKGVSVSFAKPKDAEDMDSFSAKIKMDKGNIFKNGALDKEETLTLEMVPEKKGKAFKPNAVYKWFYADSQITNGSEGWDADGGDGWHRIPEAKSKGLDEIKPQIEGMKPSEDGKILTITPIAVPNIETFKCVAIFGGEKIDLGEGKYQTMGVVKVEASETVLDQSDPITVTILSSRGDVFKPGDGVSSTELVCRVFQGLEPIPPSKLLYSWGKYINDGKNIEYIKRLDPSEKLTVSNIDGIINTESYICEVYVKE